MKIVIVRFVIIFCLSFVFDRFSGASVDSEFHVFHDLPCLTDYFETSLKASIKGNNNNNKVEIGPFSPHFNKLRHLFPFINY